VVGITVGLAFPFQDLLAVIRMVVSFEEDHHLGGIGDWQARISLTEE